jgi:hypothetical protein
LHRPFVDAADLTPAERESWSLAFDGLLRNDLPPRQAARAPEARLAAVAE